MKEQFDSMEAAIAALRNGELLIVVDEADRENEGDLIIAAEKASPEKINFMIKEGRGLMCLPITQEKARQLKLNPMAKNTDKYSTPFTVSIDSAKADTGVSVCDRLETINAIVSDSSTPTDFVRPGHMFPLVSRKGGVLQRAGHTEATVDLFKIAGMKPVGVICEIMNDDGSMARLPDLVKFKEKHSIRMISIAQIIRHRLKNETIIERVASPQLPTKFGTFSAIGYRAKPNNEEYLAIVKGEVSGKKNVLVRVHSGCVTGDVFHSMRCDCNEQLHSSLEMIEKEGKGVLLYISGHEGRGIGLLNKLKAYELQEKGLDTVQANIELGFPNDARDYGVPAMILANLGLTNIRLITNNPEKISALEAYGLKVSEIVPIKIKPNSFNEKYLFTKKRKLGHLL